MRPLACVAIANRGEIALRIQRACRLLGIDAVQLHSEADRESAFVRLAARSLCIGPAAASASYLDQAAVLTAARLAGADAIHPGYGFLSENAGFAAAAEAAGLTFIGPTSAAIRVDSHAYAGYSVPPHYDSLIGKVIAHGASRTEAVARMRAALAEMVIEGIKTNIPLHRMLLDDPGFIAGGPSIHHLEHRLAGRHG